MLQIIILPVAFDQTFHTLCVMHFNQKRAPETNNVIRAHIQGFSSVKIKMGTDLFNN